MSTLLSRMYLCSDSRSLLHNNVVNSILHCLFFNWDAIKGEESHGVALDRESERICILCSNESETVGIP